MSTKTSNYNLQKPDPEEFADIDIINENMDIIDGKVGEIEKNLTKEISTRKEEVEVERKRIDNILTATVSTTKFLTVKSSKIQATTSEEFCYTFSSENNDKLAAIKNKNPFVVETYMEVWKLGEGDNLQVASGPFQVPSTYIELAKKNEFAIEICPDNEKIISGQLGRLIFCCKMTVAYEEDATGIHDAEMKDARIDVNGTIHDTLGNAIRAQIRSLNSIGLYIDEDGDVCQVDEEV